jgi:hypothetical protein
MLTDHIANIGILSKVKSTFSVLHSSSMMHNIPGYK